MGFFSGQDYIVIDGQKKLTNNKPPLEFTSPKTVAIPLKNISYEDFTVHVEVGDYVKIGTKLATGNDHLKLPLFCSVSGTVTAIEKRDHVSLRKTNHIVIENDFKDEKETLFEASSDILSLEGTKIKDYMKEAGVLGLGGSGVPTFTKFRNTKNVNTILINGVESEVYITADEHNMTTSPNFLIQGAAAIMKASEVKETKIVITEDKSELLTNLKELSKDYSGIEIVTVPNEYPIGAEVKLIKRLFNKTYKIMPLEVGIVSLNASTVIEFAKTLSTGLPLYERVITLSGSGFASPQNVKVRVGTVLSDILPEMGGYVSGVPKNARLVHGGPLRGNSIISDNVSVTPITNGFTCIANAENEEVACSRCSACVYYCPEGLQPIQILRANKVKDKDTLKKLGADKCIECGICSFVCPSFINVTEGAIKGKQLALEK